MDRPSPPTDVVKSKEEDTPTMQVVSDPSELLKLGIIKVKIPSSIDCARWAVEYSKLTPMILTAQGDDEEPFYRNILDEPQFPFTNLLDEVEIAHVLETYFDDPKEFRLDDAFCVHYNEKQYSTSGAKHTDPSDVTINLCLVKASDTEGSHVAFYGAQPLKGGQQSNSNDPTKVLVLQEPGYATIHWGKHPHETTSLLRGSRTNIILTYCYKDASKSDVGSRTCYA
jgi:hypothetical protein